MTSLSNLELSNNRLTGNLSLRKFERSSLLLQKSSLVPDIVSLLVSQDVRDACLHDSV